MTTLEKYMETLNDNTSMQKVVLEELSYRKIISLYDQLEIWITNIRDKST